MSAPNRHPDARLEFAQWQYLSALCDENLPALLRADFCQKTPPHAFANIACRTVFEEILAISKLPTHQSQPSLRDDLPAHVTRRGFPDLDFDLLFSRVKASSSTDAPESPEERIARTYQDLLEIAASDK